LILSELTSEIRRARIDRGLDQSDVGRAVGLSAAQVSRIERGLTESVSVRHMAMLLAVVGLELSARAYPSDRPIRDTAHAALLDRLRKRLHPSLRLRFEVPMPGTGDPRAWDGLIVAQSWSEPVEAETRPTDLQALQRRLALKLRDSGFDCVLLVLLNSRHNRALVREFRSALADAFPVPGTRALELLAVGAHPGGSSVLLL
jgi:transcriptional regulator with XRE-family HTH domain